MIAGTNRAALALAMGLAAGIGWGGSTGTAVGSPYEPTRHTLRGEEVAIYNLVGRLEIVRGEGAAIAAEVAFRGKDAERLEIAKGPIGGRETLRVLYPGDRILAPELGARTTSIMRVREDGTFGGEGRSGRKVVITGSGSGLEAAADVRIQVPRGARLRVYWGHGPGSVSGIDADLGVAAASMPIEVRDVRGDLNIDIGSGSVRVTDAESSIAIDTGSGAVALQRVRGPVAKVDTGSGDVEGREVHVETLSVDTGSGAIDLEGVRSEVISLDTGSGEVRVDVSGAIRELSVDSGSGDVTVAVPRDTGAELRVETGSGGIESDLTIETRRRARNELEGRVGNGRGRIEIETGSGTVRLLRRR